MGCRPGSRPRWRAVVVRMLFVSVIAAQAWALVANADDPHRRFAFQPFNESTTWQVTELVRVDAAGRRLPVVDGSFAGHRWDELVTNPRVRRPWVRQDASYGAAATLQLFHEALRWVAAHTPGDTVAVRWEATVTVWRNGGEPVTHRLAVDRPGPDER